MFIEWTIKKHSMIVTANNYHIYIICIKLTELWKNLRSEPLYSTRHRRIVIDNSEWHLNFVVVVVLYLVLEVYDLNLECLFLVSGLRENYQKCHLVCQINGPVIYFSHIRALIWQIICYMTVMCTMKHNRNIDRWS